MRIYQSIGRNSLNCFWLRFCNWLLLWCWLFNWLNNLFFNWLRVSFAKTETLELLMEHGSLSILQLGALRNVKPVNLTEGLGDMYDKGLIDFNPPIPKTRRGMILSKPKRIS